MRPWRYAGLLLGLSVWAACSVLLLWVELRRVPLEWGRPLAGVVAVETVPQTWANFWHGRLQTEFSRSIGQRLPLFRWAVRLRNQAEWTLLHHLPSAAVMLGREDMVVETSYTMEYCSRDIAAWRPGAVVWASRIREMQDVMTRRGHAFLYVITPSKVAQYPGILPTDFTCPAPEADRVGLIPAWLEILDKAGVHVVDTTGPLMAAQARYPFRLWPEGGTHWNTVGAAIGTDAIVAGINSVLSGRKLEPYSFAWTMSKRPIPPDDDLYLLANLFWHPNPPSPNAFTTTNPEPASCNPPRVVIVGGSFTQQVEIWLSRLPCSVPVILYGYWKRYRFTADGRDRIGGSMMVDPAERDASVLDADVLIYEENEQVLSTQQHGTALWTMLHAKNLEQAGRN